MWKEIVDQLKEEYPNVPCNEIRKKLHQKSRDAWDNIDFAEEIAAQSEEERLQDYDSVGIYGMMILSQRDEYVCEACLDHDGTQYTMEEAEEYEPLPHDHCENDECRCTSLPIPDEETYREMLGEWPNLSNLY